MSVLRSGRARAAAVAAALLALLAPTAAHAITNGKPTTEYDNVGSFVVEVEPAGGEPYLVQLCTGTMVSDRVVLTASHCMDRGAYADDWGTVWFTLEQRISDGESWELDTDLDLLTGTPVPDPRYTGTSHYAYDVGAFVLDAPVAVTPAVLAEVGHLDERSLRGSTFTTVGYGIRRDDKKKSTQAFLPPWQRMVATQPLVNVTPGYATFSMNLARGHGGTCYGDSGGPHFNAAGEVVAVTTTGDIPCKASDQATRADTQVAHDFIGDVIEHPDAYAGE
ncbi:V8-like Glu-specific endopeptidase [Nocardioides alpinus]|uniref:V8-like Glu-specific endopeptidase n=1 Tax=Nocardioides alpinus TaxID=748909 RepID=A0A1I0WEF7_9ACTN|nr:trypsin-like serine protease [Nocardioides alpinus]PKH37878.1 hypothetical protein CXG46_21060 [Nocardioides alpinus]SFA87129.1 V8-like Glu-specific endopeptidase [Nocardioides alpinus]